MTPIPFVRLDDPRYGEAVVVSPLVRRVIAPNPSRFTYHGTGTYIIGHGQIAVIDPGPVDDAHRDAVAAAITGERVVAIVVTHCHGDHSPLSAWLRAETGAPTIAIGPHTGVQDVDDLVEDLVEEDPVEDPSGSGGASSPNREPIDVDFDPDVRVSDGDVVIAADGWELRAVHTPGHTSNHLAVALDAERSLFTGDHIMGWSTTVVVPPDGEMRAYMESVRKVQGRADATLWPTHGAPVTDSGPFLAAYLAHRVEREAQVLAAVRSGISTVDVIVERLYVDVAPELHRAARRSVLAHLVKLVDDGMVAVADGAPPTLRAAFGAV